MSWLRRLLACALLIVVLPSWACAQTANYPSRVIRVVVGFAAGGGNDLFARLVVQKFEQNTGATLVIENRPGAGGRTAAEYVAQLPADGYTIMVAASGAMNRTINSTPTHQSSIRRIHNRIHSFFGDIADFYNNSPCQKGFQHIHKLSNVIISSL